jgi:hypothetical protein
VRTIQGESGRRVEEPGGRSGRDVLSGTAAGRPRLVAYLLPGLLIAAIGLLYVATVRPGGTWEDDSHLYIQHAKNIVEGRPYATTGFLYNAHDPSYSPRTYPPLFPLALAPAYALFGLALLPMQYEVIGLYLLGLVLVLLVVRRYLTLPSQLVVVGLVGLSPYVWGVKERVMSDLPFVAVAYAALLVMDREEPRGSFVRHGLLVGALCYLAFATRTVGVVLPVALVARDLLRARRLTRATIVAGVVFVALAALQTLLVGGDSSYLDQFGTDVRAYLASVARGTLAGGRAFAAAWLGGYPGPLAVALVGVLSLLALWGFVLRLRAGPGILELFAVLYAAAILLWPYESKLRLAIPLMPLYLMYALLAIEQAGTLRRFVRPTVAVALLCACLLGSYAVRYARFNLRGDQTGLDDQASRALYQYVRLQTDPAAVFVLQYPRALALYTERRATVFYRAPTDEELWRYLREIHAGFLVRGPTDPPWFQEFVGRSAADLEQTYANDEFTVLRVRGASASGRSGE